MRAVYSHPFYAQAGLTYPDSADVHTDQPVVWVVRWISAYTSNIDDFCDFRDRASGALLWRAWSSFDATTVQLVQTLDTHIVLQAYSEPEFGFQVRPGPVIPGSAGWDVHVSGYILTVA